MTPPWSELTAAAAIRHLRGGRLVAHATTSLLGIAADPCSDAALSRLDALKGRKTGQGYVHVVDKRAHAEGWIAPLGWHPWDRDDLPSPLTWVFPAGPEAPSRVRGPGDTLAVRLDHHPCVQALCGGLAHPLVSTSLNLPGQPPCATLDAIPKGLQAQLSGSFVRSPTPRGVASTVVRATVSGWRLLRAGAVSEAQLTALLGPQEATP